MALVGVDMNSVVAEDEAAFCTTYSLGLENGNDDDDEGAAARPGEGTKAVDAPIEAAANATITPLPFAMVECRF